MTCVASSTWSTTACALLAPARASGTVMPLIGPNPSHTSQTTLVSEWGEVRAWCLYASALEWEWEGVQQHCPQCEMWCDNVRHYLFHKRMVTKLRWEAFKLPASQK